MLSFIKRLFSSKKTEEEKDFAATVYEQWSSDFSNSASRRFIEEDGDGYSSHFDKGFNLKIYRKNIYAWSVNPQYQYKNLHVDAVIDFSACKKIIPETISSSDSKAGVCAFGFLLRYIDEANHLSVLLSDKGFFRIDAVFNGNQIPLIGWTEAPPMQGKYEKQYEKNHIPIQIILNDTSIALIINCTLALLLDDDTIQSEGYTAFAGQNWDDYEEVSACLKFISIESRDVQCDAAYQTWSSGEVFSSNYRMQLARSYSAVGRNIPALIETKKALNQGITHIDDCLFASQLYLSQNLFEEAFEIIQKASSIFPNEAAILEETASILYMWGKYNELSDFYKKIDDKKTASAILASIEGHYLALQGEWQKAYTRYTLAASLDSAQSMHLKNAAAMLTKLGNIEESNAILLSLLAECIEQKDLQGFTNIENEIAEKSLTPDQKNILLASRGKKAYLEGNVEKAKELLEKYLSKRGTKKDIEALFALSLIYFEEGNFEESESILLKIIKEEGAKASYYRVLSECKAKLNKKEEALEFVEKALSLDDSDGWALYLKASLLYEQGNIDDAFAAVYAALSVLNEELCILHLYAKLMKEKGRLDEVLSILDALGVHSGKGTSYRTDALHMCANFYAQTQRYEEAHTRYQKALELSPKDTILICDYAELCLKMENINEADNLVSNIFTNNAPVKLYEILASIAVKKGEFTRAEITLKQGLNDYRDSTSDYCTLLINLTHLYIHSNKTDNAKITLEELCSLEKSNRTEEAAREVFLKTSRQIQCALCNRTWFVPQTLPLIDSMRLKAQPPKDLPAGNCPTCGKVYCIECVEHTLSDDGRFSCPECKTSLKIQDKGIFYLLNKWHNEESKK